MSGFLRLITRLGVENQAANTKQYPENKENSERRVHVRQ